MFKSIIKYGLIIVLPFAFMLGLLYLPIGIHDRNLEKFAHNLYTYKLPENSRIISHSKRLGVLYSNGSQCDYEASMILSSSLSLNDLRRYYRRVYLPGAEKDEDPVNPLVQNVPDEKNMYEIKIMDWDYPPGFDYRCY